MRYFKQIIFLMIGVLSLTSCESYLDEVPDNRTQVDTKEKVSELLVAAYPDGYYAPFLEPMTDNADDKGNIADSQDLYLKSYSWEVPVNDEQDTPIGYWNNAYGAISQANQALESIGELEDGSGDLDQEKGEALLCRAYAHFMLVNIFSKHYDPVTAASDLGVPYADEPEKEVIKDYDRGTVEEVYDLIEKDLIDGLELVGSSYDQPTFHFTPDAAKAFASRFYLYKGDWDKVISYTSEVLGGNSGGSIRDWNFYSNNLQLSEVSAVVMSPEEKANLLLVVPVSSWANDFFFTRFGLSQDKKEELYDSSNPYNKQWSYQIVQYTSDGLTSGVNKFDYIFEYTDISSNIGYPRTSSALFTYDEVLLARAEAYAMKNDFGSSLNDINAFLPKKTRNYNSSTDVLDESDIQAQVTDATDYTPFYALNAEQSSFVKFIAELGRREFYGEGLRWFDIKRFHIPVSHDFINQNTQTLDANDARRLLQIPPTAVSFGVEKNPR